MNRILQLLILSILLVITPVVVGQAAEPVDKLAIKDKWVALTIEDVETQSDIQQILLLCEQWNAKVTFFISAQQLEKNEKLIRQAVGRGHEFGNHGLYHRYWGETEQDEIRQELLEARNVLSRVTGRTPDVYKPPYNYYETKYMDAIQQISHQNMVVRGIDLADWALMSADAVVDKVKSSVETGSIIQLNYKVRQSADALPAILEQLKQSGYTVVTVSELRVKAVPTPPAKTQQPPAQLPVNKRGYYGVIDHINVSQPQVSLTFDDGGSVYRVTSILDTLKKYQAKATFFLLGNWVNDNVDLVRRMLEDGHEVANHSYSHPRFTWLSDAEIRQEIEVTQTALAEAAGQPAAALFRPPYGSYNSSVVDVVKNMGYEAVVMWDIDTRDWSGVSGTAISEHVLDRVSSGSVVLFHLHAAHTAEALEELIPALQQRGYKLNTVGQMLVN